MCRLFGIRARVHLLTAGVLLLWLAATPSASALEPGKALNQFPHRAWQTDDGLPQNSMLALAQTPDGYLWAGTFEGLVRFDGVRFTVFDPMNTPALADRLINTLAVDRSGTLWINMNRGLVGMRAGSFFQVTLPPGVIGHEINQLRAARDGGLWIATLANGLVRMSEGRFEVWKTEQGLASNEVLALTDALHGAERVRKIVQALKTLARAQAEPPRRVELHAVLDHTLEVMEPELKSRARIVKEYGPSLAVLGDETRLGQVFHQLLANAAHAIPEGHPDSHEIRLTTYQDTLEVLPRIFDPFFTTKEAGEGTGLGLSICHSTIEAMGGEIQVESALGQGSTFRILLPPFSE